MRRFEILQSDTDTTTSHSGLALVGRALCLTRLGADLDDNIPLRHGIAHSDYIVSYVGIVCTGKSDFDAVENRREDAFFKTSLGITKVPSAPSLRQRFDEHANAMIPHVDNASVAFLGNVGATVSPIEIVEGTCLARRKLKLTPLDIDVFPMDNSGTKKEGVSYTYKGFNGYAPLAAYLGQEGWCLACELRPGSQHGQKEFIHFLERVLPRAKRLALHKLLARLDSGHDAAENRAAFVRECVEFIIKWNPRRQDLGAWLKRAEKEVTHWSFPREGKRVGVNRGYTVTTGVWARGVLQDEYGVDLSKVTWVLSGDEHVAEYQPPGYVQPIEKGRKTRPDIKLGICGEHGGDPDSVKFCH
mgnify:CR=1 FL=1